jgi:hypothetical protein
MKKLLLSVLIALIACSLSAQNPTASAKNYTFKVLVNKGQNQLKVGNDWLTLKVGASLKAGDELKISPNAYVGLVHVEGKPLEVKDAGLYRVSDLAERIKGGSSVLNKYTDFILSTREEKSGNLNATGAVKRGDDDIRVYLPDPSIVYNDEISFAWAKMPKTSDYVVRFNSMFGDELDRIETTDTVVSINLSGAKFTNEDNIVVTVSSKSDSNKKSEPLMIKKLSAADKTRIKTALSEIKAQTKEQTVLNKLFLAAFYEQNALLIDASTNIQEAIKLAPTVPQLQDDYRDFLVRHSFGKKLR